MSIWSGYGGGSFVSGSPATRSVAKSVLDACGISNTDFSVGGALKHIDIKHMDATTAIKASLFEALVDGNFYEMISNKKGDISCKKIKDGSVSGDLYYTFQTSTYNTGPASVMVTGQDPLPERKIGAFIEVLSSTFNKKIWDASVINSSCTMPGFKQHAVITYDDPMISSAYGEGIDSLSGSLDAYESITGYVYEINGTGSEDVEVQFNSKSVVPIKADGVLGTLAVTQQVARDYAGHHDDCLRGLGEDATGGVSFNIPSELRYDGVFDTIDKFCGVVGVYAVGYRVGIMFLPIEVINTLEKPSATNTKVWIVPDDTTRDIIQLSAGLNYAVGYSGNTVNIQFADRAPVDFQGICGEGIEVLISSSDSYNDVYTATVNLLPTSENEGIVVQEIWAAMEVASPSISIFDPSGNALSVAENVSMQIAVVTTVDKPAPIAINGSSINLEDGISDHDPTTTQSFSNTDLETALEKMDGMVGMCITMASLSEAQASALSSNIKALYDNNTGVYTSYVYGPNCSVEIGDSAPDGGVVNSITYSYTDSVSFTVSVGSGPTLSGGDLCALSGGEYTKKTESVSVQGTVIQDAGNGGMFKVMCNGIGAIQALNGSMDVLRVGDVVTVTIHNNPVET